MDTDFLIDKSDLAKLTDIQLSPQERLHLLKHHINIEGICKQLKTDLHTGLVTAGDSKQHALKARKLAFGSNEIPKKRPKSFINLIWLALHDKLLLVLLVCSLISIILSLFFEPDKCVCIKNTNLTRNFTSSIAENNLNVEIIRKRFYTKKLVLFYFIKL